MKILWAMIPKYVIIPTLVGLLSWQDVEANRPPWMARSYGQQTPSGMDNNHLNMAFAQKRVSKQGQKNKSLIESATNTISDTVTAALSWDPTGVG